MTLLLTILGLTGVIGAAAIAKSRRDATQAEKRLVPIPVESEPRRSRIRRGT